MERERKRAISTPPLPLLRLWRFAWPSPTGRVLFQLPAQRQLDSPWDESCSTLLVEGALGSLVWFPKFRYWVLGAGVIFHLSLDFFMRLHLFHWIMIVSLLLFVDSADVRAVIDFFQSLIG